MLRKTTLIDLLRRPPQADLRRINILYDEFLSPPPSDPQARLVRCNSRQAVSEKPFGS